MGILSSDKEFFGLDVGSTAARLVQVKKSVSKPALVTYGSINLPSGLTQSDSKIDVSSLADIIKELTRSARVSTRNVVASLPGSAVFTAVIKIPSMSASELGKAIKWQAEQNIPLSLDEVKLDWQVLKKPTQETNEMTVMLVAAPIGKVSRLISVLEAANLNVSAVETSSVAFTRALINPPYIPTLILNIGSEYSELAISEEGAVFHTRSLTSGGGTFTRAISQNLGLDMAQAEQFKFKFGMNEGKLEGQVYRSIKPILDGIIDEVLRSLKFYQDQFGTTVEKMILTGGSAYLPDLTVYLSAGLNIEVTIGNPWTSVAYPASVENQLASCAAEYATAVGLALRGLK